MWLKFSVPVPFQSHSTVFIRTDNLYISFVDGSKCGQMTEVLRDWLTRSTVYRRPSTEVSWLAKESTGLANTMPGSMRDDITYKGGDITPATAGLAGGGSHVVLQTRNRG